MLLRRDHSRRKNCSSRFTGLTYFALFLTMSALEDRGPRPNATEIADDSSSELDIADRLLDIIQLARPNDSFVYEQANPDKIRVLSNIIRIQLDDVTHDSSQIRQDSTFESQDSSTELEIVADKSDCSQNSFQLLFLILTIVTLVFGLYCSVLTTIIFLDRQKTGLYIRTEETYPLEEHSLTSSE